MEEEYVARHQKPLIIGAIGVVYGDIGTSPLYALQASFSFSGIEATKAHVLGIVSLLIWSLFVVVSYKYIRLIMPVNNNGEGGVLSLAAQCGLLMKNKALAVMCGILGISFFFGDAMYTPAISVLSAIEGLKILSPIFTPYVVPLSFIIILLLFAVQYRGSGVLGHYFGYVMILWFVAIGLFGAWYIYANPEILKAFNPYYGIRYLSTNGVAGVLSMGGVVLAITGGEALYADMGHFGVNPIKKGWYFLVLPSLLLSYLGQGGLLLIHPELYTAPFYSMVPKILIVPMVVLAAAASIIGSQSILSGVFSISWHAVMLRYFPKLKICQTSSSTFGQVYVPMINGLLCILTLMIIITFKTSGNIASAYGICVSCTMLLTTILIALHAHLSKRWGMAKTVLLLAPLLVLDIIFCGCCFMKLFDGAWTAIVVSASVYLIIYLWMYGNKEIDNRKNKGHFEISSYIKRHIQPNDPKIPGIGVFFSRVKNTIPTSFAAHVRQNKFIHEKVFFLSVITENYPNVGSADHFECEEVSPNIYQITAKYGYKQIPDVSKIILWLCDKKIIEDTKNIWYFMSRRHFVLTSSGLVHFVWSRIFRLLSNVADSHTEFYCIPHSKVIDIGLHYKI